MTTKSPRHKVFISFHEEDIEYKEAFVRRMGDRIVDMSVDTGNIDDTGLKTTRVRQIIRDEYIRDATVTVVLIGPCAWQRKHIDWEIGASIRQTKRNSRCGILGILLPNHPNYGKPTYNPNLIPPRLADNCTNTVQYGKIYNWPQPWATAQISDWIHQTYLRRREAQPDNARYPFGRNWIQRRCVDGWTD